MGGDRYSIVFDGGSRGNPGQGYGSYRIRAGGGPWGPPVRLEFGSNVTNNEAEYMSLIAALVDLSEQVGDPSRVTVEILGDSKLVISQLKGEWKVKARNLWPLFDEARSALAPFGRVRLRWHARDRSVALLGH
ncbi:MAG: ribonuclease HI family protein [Anaerolineae bacterium]